MSYIASSPDHSSSVGDTMEVNHYHDHDHDHDHDQPIEPKDRYSIAYIMHFLLGAGYLIPWNSFITAVDYFQDLYPEKHVSKVFSVAYMVSALAVLIGLTAWSSSAAVGRLPGLKVRMNVGYGLFVLALMVPPVTDWIEGKGYMERGSGLGFGVLVSMVAVTGFAEGLTSGSLIGATGKLPRRYTQAVVAGNASSGVLVCMLRIITKASLPHSRKGLRSSTHIYFFTSIFIELFCILCCNLMHKLPIIRHYKTKPELDENISESPKILVKIFKRIRWLAMSMVAIYIVTLSIFPGYLSENVKSSYFGDWYAVFLITIFNVGDFSGKCLTALYVVNTNMLVVWGCVSRVVFYPLFIGCVFGPKWLRTEVPVALLTLLLGISGGYLTSVVMIIAPKSVPVEQSNIAGITMSLFLAIGLAVGSGLGWLWNI